MAKPAPAPADPLPTPAEGGTYIRHPDGSLERVIEPTKPADMASPKTPEEQ